jgi:hypothetical protein
VLQVTNTQSCVDLISLGELTLKPKNEYMTVDGTAPECGLNRKLNPHHLWAAFASSVSCHYFKQEPHGLAQASPN